MTVQKFNFKPITYKTYRGFGVPLVWLPYPLDNVTTDNGNHEIKIIFFLWAHRLPVNRTFLHDTLIKFFLGHPYKEEITLGGYPYPFWNTAK